ncbi:putative ribonuclease H-like domain-containing protein [Tanacetum coccineum]
MATKDESSGILKTFRTGIENQINHKVKIIRCDNRTEFKNNDMNQLCGMKGIKREFSVARTPQQNGVAERKNMTLIEAATTMLADSLLPTTFWAEAVNTAFTAGNQNNKNAGIKDNTQQYILLPLLYDSLKSLEDAVADDAGSDDQNVQDFRAALDNLLVQQKEGYANNTNRDSTVSAARQSFTNADDLLTDPLMPDLEDTADLLNTGIFSGAYDDEDVGAEADLNNLETTMNIDMKSAFLYGTIEEEVYVCQAPSFEDPQFPDKVYKGSLRYLKGKPKWAALVPKDSPFNWKLLSDYLIMLELALTATIVANSTTKAEYVAAANCCGQVGDEAVHKELGDRMERAATTALARKEECRIV